MRFIVTNNRGYDNNVVYLENSNWDDWFQFETVYIMYYKNRRIGSLKIGRRGQTERRVTLPSCFAELPEECFSLGCNVDYYASVKNLGDEEREEILVALHDLAYDLELFESVSSETVVHNSLLRDVSQTSVRRQFHRIAIGQAIRTDYDFSYTLPLKYTVVGENDKISFKVEASNNLPPSNVHVLVGNNGIGKTTILKAFLMTLLSKDELNDNGIVETGWGSSFSNVVNISFGAYDNPIVQEDLTDPPIPYKYIGLVNARYINGERQLYVAHNTLPELFGENYYQVISSHTKKELWKKAIEILETDTTFKDLDINSWEEIIKERVNNYLTRNAGELNSISILEKKKQYSIEVGVEGFYPMSSGHKSIMLTLINLINHVEEQTLVILDEPEAHLHPPLVSAFIRALSNLLSYRNGVAIIATHSPVIVQEVPKKCIWKINRSNDVVRFDRPSRETFGENLGELTSEVFDYDYAASGFHELLRRQAQKSDTYQEALREFNGEIGNEAKSLLREYLYDKEHKG